MKVKKNKGHRRAIRFYTACYGFREPFKILCDGTFVHHLLKYDITPADTALKNTLGGAVKLFTTRCVISELSDFAKKLAKKKTDSDSKDAGKSFSDALEAASNLLIARCSHETRISASSCLTEVIGENNQEHFFVGTQDKELKKMFQEIPGVPIIYALRNALMVERPSAAQQKFVKEAEEKRLHLTEVEQKMLKLPKKHSAAADDELMDSSNANEDPSALKLDANSLSEMALKDKAQLKRKRAKGPNPLSCKKKKTKENSGPAPTKENGGPEGESLRSRKRNRPRKRKDKSDIKAVKAVLATGE